MEVDLPRKRIALSMKSKPEMENRRSTSGDRDNSRPGGAQRFQQRDSRPPQGGGGGGGNDWFSQALNNAKKK